MAKRILLLVFSIIVLQGYAQQSNPDSLQEELNNHPEEDSTRLDILLSMASAYSGVSPRKGLELADLAIILSKKLQDTKRLALAYKNKGLNYQSAGEDSLALQFYGKALDIYEKLQYQPGIARIFHNMGMIYSSQAYYAKALKYHQRSAEIFEKLGDKENLSSALNSLGVNYNFLSDFPSALECYLRSMSLYEQSADTLSAGLANVFVNMGIVYKNLTSYAKSLEYQQKALVLFRQLSDKQGVANAFSNLGAVYDNLSKPAKALESYMNALALHQEVGDKRRMATDLINIGVVYNGMSEFSRAFEFLDKALAIYKILGDTYNSSLALSEIGKVYCYAPVSFLAAQGVEPSQRYARAIEFQNKALDIARETGALNTQATALEYLSLSYEKEKNYSRALNSYKKFISVRDSMYNSEKETAVTRREMQFEFDKKQALLNAENDKRQALAGAEIQRQRIVKNSVMAGVGILILAGMSSFVFYKKKRDAEGLKKEAEFKAQVTDTEMKALRSQMNPHFIFNSLNSISDYMSRYDLKSAGTYLTKFAKLMRMILENSERHDVTLADDLNTLEIYMQLESMRLQDKFSYEIYVDESIDRNTTLIPPLILQPFVENSIWHGISQKEGLGKILIHIKKEGEMINCIVEDNGIGRPKTVSIKPVANNEENRSLGMKITKARIDIINKIKKSTAAVELTDLEEGTRVEVRLPFVNY